MILVTGATGMVGGNLIWHLLQQNDRVSAIRRSTSNLKPLHTIFSFYTSRPDDFLRRIDWIIADMLDVTSIQNALRNAKSVYHCAAMVSLGQNADEMLETNIVGTKNIVQAALDNCVENFCFVSSIAACGKTYGKELIDENTDWKADGKKSPYSLSKYYSEQEVWKGIGAGLHAVIVNPGVILGVSGTSTGSSQLFSQVRKGLMFYTNGGSGYVDVRDVVKSMMELMKHKKYGERYILVGENCSNKEVLSWMADGYGKRRPFISIGKSTLRLVGIISEISGKLFSFTPLIDSSTARTASNRSYYSNKKIKEALEIQFLLIEESVIDICKFEKLNG
ncbi:MAG: NAD-dependent epimerase/dehydratase family protein [Paludibacter sp.]